MEALSIIIGTIPISVTLYKIYLELKYLNYLNTLKELELKETKRKLKQD